MLPGITQAPPLPGEGREREAWSCSRKKQSRLGNKADEEKASARMPINAQPCPLALISAPCDKEALPLTGRQVSRK